MTRVAFLFPGQGSQVVGMGRTLLEASAAARRTFEEADRALADDGGPPLSSIILEGPADELKRTRNTQPAILTVSVAACRALEERGVAPPHVVAGHSLGEYSALVAAGSLSFPDAVRAVRVRGTLMQESVPEGDGAMAAVLGLAAPAIAAILQQTSTADAYVAVANYNGPDQTVIAGSRDGVAAATAALKTAGAKRVLPLPVSAPFHCAMMAPAQRGLEAWLTTSAIAFHAPKVPVVTNVEARVNTDGTRVRELLVQQVTAAVRFTEMVELLVADGVDTCVEVGPGKVLSGIVKRMHATMRLLHVDDAASLNATVDALAAAPR